jgi:hypothetical protein
MSNIRLLVEPLNGSGEAWIELSRVSKADFLITK